MKRINRLSVKALSVLLLACLALPWAASAEMVRKVDNFIVFIDQSGSMAWAKAEPGNQKFEQAVRAVQGLDKATPELGYNSGVAAFAPYKSVSAPATYKNGSLSAAASGIAPPFNTFTTMGDDLGKMDGVITPLNGKTAVILFTDGASNQGADPVAAAKALYDKHGADVCLHVVSYADTPEGQATINGIKALNGCSMVAEGKSLASDAAMAQFAQAILYEEVQPKPAPKPAPAPAPAPVPVAKEVVTFDLLFGFDKSAITDEMIPVLEQVKMILEEDSTTDFVLSGHTDSTGTEEYNQGLSERRAASVSDWLVASGVASSRLQTVGYGETAPKYDNATREGRKLNRRVELQSK